MEEQFDFGKALEALKAGKRVQRAGWNGKGMWLALQKGYLDGVEANANSAEALHVPEGTNIKVHPYVAMKAVDGSIFPWTPNQLDMMAQDWRFLE